MTYTKKYRSSRSKLLWAVVIALAIVSGSAGYTWSRLESEKTHTTLSQINRSNDSIEGKSKNLVRALVDIESGELADSVKFEIVEVPEAIVPSQAVASMSELSNMRIRNRLSEKQFVMKSDLIPTNAWYDDEDRLLEHVFQPGAIPLSVAVGSIIDVKLFRQFAEDPVVISKAVVIDKQENTMSLYLNSKEQEYLKEAATEGLLYVVQYLDINQSASETSYEVDYIEEELEEE